VAPNTISALCTRGQTYTNAHLVAYADSGGIFWLRYIPPSHAIWRMALREGIVATRQPTLFDGVAHPPVLMEQHVATDRDCSHAYRCLPD